MTPLERELNTTVRCLSICAPIVSTPGFLNLTLYLGFHLDHWDNLGTVLHNFGMGQHNSIGQKVPKARIDQHQVITDGSAALSLSDAITLTAPDGVSFTETLTMARGSHTRMRVFLDTLLGWDHPTA